MKCFRNIEKMKYLKICRMNIIMLLIIVYFLSSKYFKEDRTFYEHQFINTSKNEGSSFNVNNNNFDSIDDKTRNLNKS